MNTRTGFFAAFAIFAVSAVSALADTVDMRFVGTGSGRNVRVTTPDRTFNVFAGQLRHSFSNGTGAASALNGELLTYCTDLTQYVSSTTRSFTVRPVGDAPVGNAMGMDKARAIASLYDYAMGTQINSTSSADMACAFQLAVWEIVSDFNWSLGSGSLSLSTGNFRASQTNGSPVWSTVNTLLNGLFNHTNNSSFSPNGILAITSSNYQDQLIQVPAPGAAMLAGLGLTLLAGRRRSDKLA